MLLYLVMLANIVILVLLMLFETYSIYEYRTCENYLNNCVKFIFGSWL